MWRVTPCACRMSPCRRRHRVVRQRMDDLADVRPMSLTGTGGYRSEGGVGIELDVVPAHATCPWA